MTLHRAFAIVALPLCLHLATSTPKAAQPEARTEPQDIQHIATLLPNNKEMALKLAAAMGGRIESVEGIMNGFRLRKKHGFGIGPMPDAIQPDGIELFLHRMDRDDVNLALLTWHSAEFQEMGHRIAAIAEVARHYPVKGLTLRSKKDWDRMAADLREGGLKLADAAKAKKPDDFNAAVGIIVQQCAGCHTVFRE